MAQEFVPYELAVKLKALGFNGECATLTFFEAFRWLRKNYNMVHVFILDTFLDTNDYTVEEAELATLKQLVEHIESKEK